MGFQKGNPGRPPGALSKRTLAFYEAVHDEGFDAAKAIIDIYRKAIEVYNNYATVYQALEAARNEEGVNPVPTEDKADKYLKIALDAAKEIASYCYPKLKSVEQVQHNVLDGMTAEQKLEAMREAVKMMEKEVGQADSPVSLQTVSIEK